MPASEMAARRRIEEFRHKMQIDKHRLDDHLVALPNEIQELTELIGELQGDAAAAKANADRAYNHALTELFASVDPMTNKPFPIEKAKAFAEADEDFVGHSNNADQLRDVMRLAESMLAGLRQKAESCKLLAQLHATGYMAPSATYSRDRTNYIAAREATAARRNESNSDQSPIANTRPRPVGK